MLAQLRLASYVRGDTRTPRWGTWERSTGGRQMSKPGIAIMNPPKALLSAAPPSCPRGPLIRARRRLRHKPPRDGTGHDEGQHDGLQHLDARIRRDQTRERREEGTAGLREDEYETCVERVSLSVSGFPSTRLT